MSIQSNHTFSSLIVPSNQTMSLSLNCCMLAIIYILYTSGIKTDAILHIPTEEDSNSLYGYINEVYLQQASDGVQNALNECRDKFKWDRWNCPKSIFSGIILRQNPLPNNRELAFARALIASSIVLAVIQNCTSELTKHPKDNLHRNGCMKSAFDISRSFLDVEDYRMSADSQGLSVILHNYEAGRLAVNHTMREQCKCHGVSGSCTTKTCWKQAAKINKVGDYLRKQYRLAAKVDLNPIPEANVPTLKQQLDKLDKNKLVFIDSSPDYCYENKTLGINGTLGRFCSKRKWDDNRIEVSKSERNSCERLCRECGYKIHTQSVVLTKPCQCKFKFCCSVECMECHKKEEIHQCVRYS